MLKKKNWNVKIRLETKLVTIDLNIHEDILKQT